MRRFLLSALAGLALTAALGPGTARADTQTSYEGARFEVASLNPAESVIDRVTISYQSTPAPTFLVSDPTGVQPSPLYPCTQFSLTIVSCQAVGVTDVATTLGEGADELNTAGLTVQFSSMSYDLGAGNDRWLGGPAGERTIFGPGRDKGVAGGGDDVGIGGGGNDAFEGDDGRDRFSGGKGRDRVTGSTEKHASEDARIGNVALGF